MAERTCRFISSRGASSSPAYTTAEEIFESYVTPVVTSNFSDFTVHLSEYDPNPRSLANEFLENILDMDLVIADMTELDQNAYFQ